MLQKLQFLIITLLLFSIITIHGQQPSHYFLDTDELFGVHIYGIIQDKEANIWLSSNKGIMRYDGYDFHKYPIQNAESSALFGLKTDRMGTIFCCNINGQIFRLEDDTLREFYKIPDSLLSNLITFNFDNQNDLLVCGRNYILVNKEKKAKFLLKAYGIPKNIYSNKYGELLLTGGDDIELYYYKDKQLYKKKETSLEKIPNSTFSVVIPGDNNLFYNYINTSKILIYKQGKWNNIDYDISLQEGNMGFARINDTVFFMEDNRNGIYFFNDKGEGKFNGVKLFPRHRISGHLTDQEDNIWLTTLGKGILIIPNLNIIDYNNHPLLKKDDIKAITSDRQGNIYLGGANGILYKVTKHNISEFKVFSTKIEYIEYVESNNSLLLNGKIFFLDNMELEETMLPWHTYAYHAGNDFTLIASRTGFALLNWNKKNEKNIKIQNIIKTHSFRGRAYSVYYDSINNEILAGTSQGLISFGEKKAKEITYKNKRLSVLNIININNEVWVTTYRHGILIYKHGEFQREFKPTKGMIVNHLKKINNKLYYTTKYGLNIYNLEKEELQLLSKTDGLLSNFINGFELVNDKLWIIFPNGVQEIDPHHIYKNIIKPKIQFTDFIVNDKAYDTTQSHKLEYDKNRIEFRFIAKAYRHQGSLIYRYKLEGLDEEWRTTSFDNNRVKYPSLPHGMYTFFVKAINENQTPSEAISYSFSISQPFWKTWWFIVSFFLTGAFTTILFFIIRIKRIKQRNELVNQLKSSEITAIKAQMNPHFMFNALNSVQDLIMQKDIRASNIYLGKFAELMRKTLESSSKNSILLNEEVEMLQLYLDLEKLRFGDDFSCNIECDFEDKTGFSRSIPAMLLQPYVENAIKHGLLHKTGKKKISIVFREDTGYLICEIMDNGVGRKRSQEINKRREKNYPSFSSKANRKRIDLIRESTNQDISMEIIDLYENEKAMGTKVVFRFPLVK